MENTEYIDDYFNELQTQEEKLLFEQRIREDGLFAKEVAFYISANATLKDEVAVKKKIRFKEIYQQEKIVPAKIIPIWSKWRYIAAACVVFAVIIFSWLMNDRQISGKQMADSYMDQNFKTLGVSMGTKQDLLQSGLNLFNNGKLRDALLQFENIVQTDSTNDVAAKYAGITALQLKAYDTANIYFTKLEETKNLFSNPGKFYKAITLLERNFSGDKENAIKLLQEVVKKDLEGKLTAIEWLKKM